MAGVTLGGLASGLDTQSLIAKLMTAERAPLTRLTAAQKRAEARKTVLDDVAAQLRALKTAATDLRATATWAEVQSVASSDSTKVGARATGTIAAGTYQIDVLQLARKEQRTYSYTQTIGDNLTVNGKSISLSPLGATPADAVTAINNTAGVGVVASLTSDGKGFTLAATAYGAPISLSSSRNAAVEDTTKQQLGQMTQYSVNGVRQADVADVVFASPAIAGLELTAKAVGTSTITVGAPGVDVDKVKGKVKAFVDAYNGLVTNLRGRLTESKVANPVTSSDYGKGALHGDTGLTALLSNLRIAASGTIGTGNPTSLDQLSELGVSVQGGTSGPETQERLQGQLKLDDAKLSQVLAANPTQVKRLFGGVAGVDGFAQKVEALVDPVARTGDGSLAVRSSQVDLQVGRIKRQYDSLSKRLDLREQALRDQFTRMESAMNSSQTQQSWLSGQIARL